MSARTNTAILACLILLFCRSLGATELITNVDHRTTFSLDGRWNVIVDPYETGYYDYRYKLTGDSYFLKLAG